MVNLTPIGAQALPSAPPAVDTRLRGFSLVVARTLWAGIAALALGLFVAALPERYEELVTLSLQARHAFQQLSPVEQRTLAGLDLWLDGYASFILMLEIVVVVVFCVTTAVIIWRKSDDWMALFVSLAHVTYAVYISPPLDTLMKVQPAWGPLVNMVQALGLTCALLFFYLLPDGRLTPRWTRPLALLWIALTPAWGLFPAAPFNFSRPFELPLGWFLIFMGWWFSGVLAQLGRYWRVSGSMQRKQTKWIVGCCTSGILGYAAVYMMGYLLSAFPHWRMAHLLYILFGVPLFLALLIPIPLAVSFSIFRYRLFDIDVVLNRTLVYGTLTVLLAGVYGLSVVALQLLLFGAFTGQAAPLVVAASTLAAAALFHPLRRRVQAFIDRRFFRRKYDAAQTLATVGAALRHEVNLTRLVERLETAVEDTLQPAHVLTWLSQTPNGFRVHLLDDEPREQTSARNGAEIAAEDAFVGHLRQASAVVELDRLALSSPALGRLKSVNVKLVAPLVTQGELIGWLSLGPRLSEENYSADDRALLAQLSAQVAPALRVAQLARQQQVEALERERRGQEMRLARLIQHRLLPEAFPAIPGCRAATHYQPAREVGGDFYDFLLLEDRRLGLVIGDVMGKGVPAALVMATTRANLRAAARPSRAPGEVLRQVNNLLCPDMPPGLFVTCLYAVLDPVNGRLQYANAGHNPPYRRCGDGVLELKACGMPLGLMPDMDYKEQETTLTPGDRLLLYSDGLVEARNARGEMFGNPRLMTLLGAPGKDDADRAVLHDLVNALQQFTGPDGEQADDVTLVMLEWSAAKPN